MVYGTQITIVNGVYKPTNITGGPHIVIDANFSAAMKYLCCPESQADDRVGQGGLTTWGHHGHGITVVHGKHQGGSNETQRAS